MHAENVPDRSAAPAGRKPVEVRAARASTPSTSPKSAPEVSGTLVSSSDAPQPAAARPQVHVVLKSAGDEAVDSESDADRRMWARRVSALLIAELEQDESVGLVSSELPDPSVDPYGIDVALVKLAPVERDAHVDVECEIRVSISTRDGKMLSVLTGGAKVEVPRGAFREELLPQLGLEVMEVAVDSVHRDLVAYLLQLP